MYYVIDTTRLSLMPGEPDAVGFETLAEALEDVAERLEYMHGTQYEVRVGSARSANMIRIDGDDYRSPRD